MPTDAPRGKHAGHSGQQGSLEPQASTPNPSDSPEVPTGYLYDQDWQPRIDQDWHNQIDQDWQSQIHPDWQPGMGTPTDAHRYSRVRYAHPSKKRTSAARKVVCAILALLILFIISLGVSGGLMATHVNDLKSQVSTLQKELFAGDPATAQAAATDLAKTMQDVNAQARMPQWKLASMLPFIGNDFKTVTSLIDSADRLCSNVVLPLTTDMTTKNTGPFLVEGSRINAPAVQSALETLSLNAESIHACSDQVLSVDSALVPIVNDIRRQAHGVFRGLDALTSASPNLAPQVPWLLGADGSPRNYLLVALSNAEIRSIGGLPGSYGVLTIDNGAMSTHDFLALKDTPRYVPTDIEDEDTTTIAPGLTDEEYVLFGRRVVNVPAETAVNPQFPRFAESFSWLRTYREHGETEGVIAIDPLFLQDLLSVTGSVTTSDNTVVSSSNVVRLLLNDIYFTKTPEEQDAFFSEVATLCFDSLIANINAKNATGLLQALWHASNTRNLQAWFPNTELEFAMDTLGYSGTVSYDPANPVLGVYVSDDTWSKISWYLSLNTLIGKPVKNADGTTSYTVTTAIENHLTPTEAETLPTYVAGSNWRKRSPGDMLDWVFFYAPAGGTITDMKADAYFTPLGRTRYGFNGMLSSASMNEATHMGLNVWYGAIQIDAGQKAVFTYTVTTAPDSSTELALDQTPTAEKAAGWQ